jgi:O-antigen ligase
MASTQPGIRAQAVVGVAVLTLLALFLGITSALLPWWLIFSALMVPALATLLLVRPEFALTGCIALVCGLVHPGLVPRIPVLGGALAAADAALAMLAMYALWTYATRVDKSRPAPVAGARLLALALGLFGVSLAIAVTTSLSLRELNPAFVLGETRDLIYLITLPIALVILRERERQERFVVSLVVLGCLFSVGQILQGVFDVPVFGKQGISALETLGRQEDSTTRANTLGLNVIVFSLLLTIGAYVVGSIRKPLFLLVAGLLFVGIVLTFGRTTFAAVFICGLLVVWWLNKKRLPQLAIILVITIGLGSALAAYWKPDSFAAVYYRLTSIGEEIDHGYSAQWRIWEAEAMLPHIKEHPLLGVGLGADYKGARGSSLRPELNRYVHNAYLYMAGKMGLPALFCFLLFMSCVFAVGRRSARSHALPWTRIVGAAGAAMMIRFLFASIAEPHFMSDYGVINIAIAGALVVLSAQRVAPAGTAFMAAQTHGPGPDLRPVGTRTLWRPAPVGSVRGNAL